MSIVPANYGKNPNRPIERGKRLRGGHTDISQLVNQSSALIVQEATPAEKAKVAKLVLSQYDVPASAHILQALGLIPYNKPEGVDVTKPKAKKSRSWQERNSVAAHESYAN